MCHFHLAFARMVLTPFQIASLWLQVHGALHRSLRLGLLLRRAVAAAGGARLQCWCHGGR